MKGQTPGDLPLAARELAGAGKQSHSAKELSAVSGAHPWTILLVITTTDFGGAESFLDQLTARLDRDMFRPLVCSLCPPGKVGMRIASRGVEVLSRNMSAQPRVGEIIQGIRWLTRVIDRHSVDLVHSILYRANVMASVSARLSSRRPRVISNQHSLNPMGDSRLAAWSAKRTRGLADRVLAVSEAVKEKLLVEEGLEESRVSVVHSGVDSKLFSPQNRPKARAALKCRPEKVLIGGVGRFSPEKGFRLLVEALGQLMQSRDALAVYLIGDGPERPRLEEMVRERGLSDVVTFLGVRQDLPEVLPALDIVVIPSLEEGLPMLLLEAMACGCAVVATATGGIPEVIENGKSGLLVPPGSDIAIAAEIERLLTDPDMREVLGNEARKRVDRQFEVQEMVSRYELEYLSLLER